MARETATLVDLKEKHGEIEEVIYVMGDGKKFSIKGDSLVAWKGMVTSSAVLAYTHGMGGSAESARRVILEEID